MPTEGQRRRRLHFPVYLWLGPIPLHPHWIFEGLGYAVGAWLYLWLKRHRGDPIDETDRLSVISAAGVGA